MTNRREEWVLVPKKPTLEMSRAVREETRFCDPVGIYKKMLAAAPPHPAITHCDNCGCDWLDNGLNPIGCPYCKQPAAVNEVKEPDLWRCTVCGRFGTVGRCCGEETRERANMEQLLEENDRLRGALEEVWRRSSIGVLDSSRKDELEVALGDICRFVDAVLWQEYLPRDQED